VNNPIEQDMLRKMTLPNFYKYNTRC